MINFFRRIRKKMADDNRPLKYMRYAVGEIVLVVVGILIALQINNWNEGQKTKKLEKEYLVRLRKDLVADTIYLSNRLKKVKKNKANIYQFIHEIYNIQNSEEEFKRIFLMQSLDASNLVMQTSTFEELKNTGLINIIQNEQLKMNLIELYREYQVAAEHFFEINNFSSREVFGKSVNVAHKYWRPDLYDEKRLFEGTDWTFINDPSSENFKLLESTQTTYYIKYSFFIGHFENLLPKSKALINMISEDLPKEN